VCRFDRERDDSIPSLNGLPGHWRVALFFAALALLQGFVYAAVIPPWQSNDEHGHFEYAWLVSQYGPMVGPEAISPEFQQRVLESMYQFEYWRLCRQPTPEVLPAGFTDPSDHWLRYSRPQVGDERPPYYLLVGGLLRLVGGQDLVAGMYIGRGVSVLLFAAAVGVTVLGVRSLFPNSLFMQVVPPTSVLLLPVLGQMVASVSSDAIGVLASTLFFISLIPVFRDGLTWRRGGVVMAALVLALLSKKTALFLLPTVLLAIPIYWWTRGGRLSRQVCLALGTGVALLAITGVVLALLPGEDAAQWVKWRDYGWRSCGPTRFEGKAFEGEAALRIGTCTEMQITQILPVEVVRRIAGYPVTLAGWVRGAIGTAVGRVYIKDSESFSEVEVVAGEEWQPFSLSHTVDVNPRWMVVRLTWEGSGGSLLFDGLTLTTSQGENLLVNGSAEQKRSLLVSLLIGVTRWIRVPGRIVEQMLMPQSWSREAWREYVQAARFCFQSFWGLFGSVTLFLPSVWYRVIGVPCLLALAGNLVFIVRRHHQEWQTGYLFVLMGGVALLILQTFLPMFGMRGADWMPMGRYLFAGVFAIMVLLAWGLYWLLPPRWEKWGTLMAVIAMFVFDVACLVFVIVPYFHS